MIWILLRLTFLALLLAVVYRQLVYWARIDFEPEPLTGPPSPLRVGEWILDVPEPLGVRQYDIKLEIGDQFLFLSESLDEPPGIQTDSTYDLRSEKARELLVVSELSEDLGRPASMEVRFLLARQGQCDYGRLAMRVLLPQASGFLALDNWLEVPEEALGNRDKLNEIIRGHQPLLIDQAKTVLSRYSWLGPDLDKKPEGFMTRYGVLEPELSSLRATAGVYLRYNGGGVLAPIQFIFTIRAGQGPRPVDPLGSRPSFWEKMKYLLAFFTRYPAKFQDKYRKTGERPGYETEIFSSDRYFGDLSTTRMLWGVDPAPGDSGTAYLTSVFITIGFNPTRWPEFFGLWRHVLNSAH